MSEVSVDKYWQGTFTNIQIFPELQKPDNLIEELLKQFRVCLTTEAPEPAILKQLGYYIDFACQILRFESLNFVRDEEKIRVVIVFINQCRELLNGALTKPLPELYWQRIAHYVENQASRILQIREMVDRRNKFQS